MLQNTILGPGLLGLPWAVSQCGSVLGFILLVFSAFIGFLGMHFLSASAMVVVPKLPEPGALSVSAMCRLVSSPVLFVAFEAGLVIACSGALITSLIIIGDSLEHLQVLTRQEWILVVFLCVAFPLSCFKQIKFLRFSSYLSLAMILYIVGLVIVSTAIGDFPAEFIGAHETFRWDNGMKILQSVPVFTFCFCGHMNMLPVAKELVNVSVYRLDVVIFSALTTAAIIYSAVAVGAVISFGDLTPQDLLSTYHPSPAVVIARIGMTVVCAAFYPLLVQPIRGTIAGWVEKLMQQEAVGEIAAEVRDSTAAKETEVGSNRVDPLSDSVSTATSTSVQPASRQESWRRFPGLRRRQSVEEQNQRAPQDRSAAIHWILTVLVGGIALAVALSTKSLGKVFSLSGATGFALLCNVCPALLYLRLTAATPGQARGDEELLAASAGDGIDRSTKASPGMRVLAMCLLGFGLLSMPVCIAANLIAT